MWIFLNNAFVSAVAHRDKPDALMVRARLRGDLEAIFPDLAGQIEQTDRADYRFRVTITRERFAAVLADTARSIDYPNFKDSIADERRHDAYFRVWSVMRNAQEEQHHVEPDKGMTNHVEKKD